MTSERVKGNGSVTRQPISVAAKVFAAVALLGPLIGGLAFITLAELFRWSSGLGAGSLPRPIHDVGERVLVLIQASYMIGGPAAFLAGLALGAWVAWGGRLTVWSCLAAAEVYALMLAAVLLLDGLPPAAVLVQVGLIAVLSAIAALGGYLLLRKTALARGINAPASGDPGDVT